jgi:hypothetical protein
MGTRAIINIRDESGESILHLYSQWDGYPSGVGKALAVFLGGIRLVNGLTGKEHGSVANGMGCLAAQVVSHFKTEVGSIYIVNKNTHDGIDYTYEVFENRVVVRNYDSQIMFQGSWDDFSDFCHDDDR